MSDILSDKERELLIQPDEGVKLSTTSVERYIPERDYKNRDYKPYNKAFSDLCKNCKHYYKNIHDKGMTKKEFPPHCHGHVLEALNFIKQDDFTEDEFADLSINMDPIAWAYKTFEWEARWYQEEILSCTASRKIIRAGRRLGKTVALAILSLHGSQIYANYNVLIICPVEVQVQRAFDEIRKFISLNKEMESSVKSDTKNPHRIEFNNGSKIMGFSSNPNSALGADKIRGQDANFIILDEADYLADDDLTAILAILASHPDCKLWASSTPTGDHKKFYSWSRDKNMGFKEFHYISSESPSWTEEAEEYFKTQYPQADYEHEFYAEFGLQTQGVFRNDLIDLSLRDYTLPKPKSDNSRVIIGVDWNGSEIGVHIVVVEYDGVTYTLLEKSIIKREQFTQHAAVNKIVELVDKYNADFAYVDSGYGEVQVEMLHKMGVDNPASKLHKKIKPYSLTGKVEIRDPRTGEFIKKAPKPFMVNVTALALESKRIILPISEDTTSTIESKEQSDAGQSMGVVQQMRNFKIEKYSQNGQPIYSQEDDHTLSAFMLAIVGFLLEFSDVNQRKIDTRALVITPESEEGQTSQEADKLQNVPRQLDAGMSKFITKRNIISSIEEAGRAKSALKRNIAQNKRGVISKYFSPGSRTLDRGNNNNNKRSF